MNQLTDIKLLEGELEGTTATFATWLINQGDIVKQGDPIAELETDKVVMEICAATSGQIESLIAKAGDSVAVDQVLGKINSTISKATNVETISIENENQSNAQKGVSLISPAVRRLFTENNLKLEDIKGSGKSGRVTRDDVQKYIQQFNQSDLKTDLTVSDISQRESRPLAGKKIPHTPMRKSIASHMVESLLHTSPHVTSVFEMDMSAIIKHRKQHKVDFEKQGVNLSLTTYFLAAMAKGVKAVPQVNARFHDDGLELFNDVNIGIGTALGEKGLVVPVIEQVQAMGLFEIAQNLSQQTLKARAGKLTSADMKNGTITISNHGVSGSLFATPIIINQPQVAILGVGKLEKRVVVKTIDDEDYMVIKPMCYVSLSIDHRALDAYQTNQFLSVFVEAIEGWK